ncbi:hypothetical protein RZS08_61475, partial [Arthrospira platensis SPKY1]|nr:hypothetical protein [Arthrospira platensis SPKY1]
HAPVAGALFADELTGHDLPAVASQLFEDGGVDLLLRATGAQAGGRIGAEAHEELHRVLRLRERAPGPGPAVHAAEVGHHENAVLEARRATTRLVAAHGRRLFH